MARKHGWLLRLGGTRERAGGMPPTAALQAAGCFASKASLSGRRN